jgi:hypothetical protein
MPRYKFRGPLTSPLAISFDPINIHQASSRFLSLPPEIRNVIYNIIFMPEESPTVDPRSSLRIKRSFSVSLLSTCRKVYLEAHLYPLQNNPQYETIFPCTNFSRNPIKGSPFLFHQMEPWQKSTIYEVHLALELCHTCFRQGPYLKVLLSRTGMAPTLRKLHLYWVAERYSHRQRICRRAKRWVSFNSHGAKWDLKNFVQLKEITIQFEIGTTAPGHIDLAIQETKAKTWSFLVGGGRVLQVDLAAVECNRLVSFPGSSARALRWV